jgi:hypothetical protein
MFAASSAMPSEPPHRGQLVTTGTPPGPTRTERQPDKTPNTGDSAAEVPSAATRAAQEARRVARHMNGVAALCCWTKIKMAGPAIGTGP